MAAKNSFLKSYYHDNNPVVQRLTINTKLITRLWMFVGCSIVYYIINILDKGQSLQTDDITNVTRRFMNIVMYMTYILSALGVILELLLLLFKSPEMKLRKVSYQFKKRLFVFLDWIIILPVCCTIATFCYNFLFVITPVDGHSMTPTIQDAERVLISYISKIDRFDVVVVKVTPEDNTGVSSDNYYIKRLIGLPGDRIRWENKILYINDTVVDEYYFPNNYLNDIAHFLEFNGTFSYKENGETKYTYVIPDNYYFVMGDNRNIDYYGGSYDSRQIGLIPSKNIIGVAKYHMKSILPGSKII